VFEGTNAKQGRTLVKTNWGRATAQVVSRRLPTAAAQVQSQIRSCRTSSGQSSRGGSFLRVLWFPPLILILSTALYSLIICHRSCTVSILIVSLKRKERGRKPRQPHREMKQLQVQTPTSTNLFYTAFIKRNYSQLHMFLNFLRCLCFTGFFHVNFLEAYFNERLCMLICMCRITNYYY
jgi:hypothetical protein